MRVVPCTTLTVDISVVEAGSQGIVARLQLLAGVDEVGLPPLAEGTVPLGIGGALEPVLAIVEDQEISDEWLEQVGSRARSAADPALRSVTMRSPSVSEFGTQALALVELADEEHELDGAGAQVTVRAPVADRHDAVPELVEEHALVEHVVTLAAEDDVGGDDMPSGCRATSPTASRVTRSWLRSCPAAPRSTARSALSMNRRRVGSSG